MHLNGIHHISAITGDALANVDFYTRVMGMRLIAKTVNQDDPGAYHLFYGDEHGRPGFDLTFFEYPGAMPGRVGAGVPYRIRWRVGSPAALEFWERRLEGEGRATRREGDALVFADPEGLEHALVPYDGPDPPLAATHPEVPAEHALLGFDGVHVYSAVPDATRAVLEGLMGATASPDGAIDVRGGSRGGWVHVDAAPGGEFARQGAGVVHHIAFATNDDDQPSWDQRVRAVGIPTSGIVDRHFFRSVYFREPGGLLFELATEEPGFGVTGPEDRLGMDLFLPPWLEPRRELIESRLVRIPDPRADWPGRPAGAAA
jgi:glyoxalase family protein